MAGDGYICTHNTKSEFASYLLPAWFLGKYPDKKVIQTSHTAELSVGFGRKVRNLIDSEMYHHIFDDVKLKADNKSAGDTIRVEDFRTGESYVGLIEEMDFINKTPSDKRFHKKKL